MSETLSLNSAPVWFVTGCSTGFGREFVRQLLAGGVGRWLFVSLCAEDADPVREQDYSIYGKPSNSGRLTAMPRSRSTSSGAAQAAHGTLACSQLSANLRAKPMAR